MTNFLIRKNYDRKKYERVAARNRAKLEAENEDRIVIPTNREQAKEAHKNTHYL